MSDNHSKLLWEAACCFSALCLTPSPLQDLGTCRHRTYSRQVLKAPNLSRAAESVMAPAVWPCILQRLTTSTGQPAEGTMCPDLSSPVVQCIGLAPWNREGFCRGMELEVRWHEAQGMWAHFCQPCYRGGNPQGSGRVVRASCQIPHCYRNKIRRCPKTPGWTTCSPGKMGQPWHTWQARNKHASSDFACAIQPGAAGAKTLF